jgi:hypothetical protein
MIAPSRINTAECEKTEVFPGVLPAFLMPEGS